jgi:YnbE-like lipoprotein
MTMTMPRSKFLLLLPLGAAMASCVTVNAPEKPIEINLNVDIRQEVLVRMQRDVEQLIRQNPQAFPQNTPETPRQQ